MVAWAFSFCAFLYFFFFALTTGRRAKRRFRQLSGLGACFLFIPYKPRASSITANF